MKTPYHFLCTVLACMTIHTMHAQTTTPYPTTKGGRPIYFSLAPQIGIPVGQFRNYSKVQGGADLAAAIGFKANPSFSAGAAFSVLGTGAKIDNYRGLQVKTDGALFMVGPMVRWAPVTSWRIVPFVGVSSGLGISSTTTTSEIVDKATFFEQFVGWQEEDIVNTTTHMQSGGTSLGYSLSAGVLIKPAFTLAVTYFAIDQVKYVNKDDVSFADGEISYTSNVVPVQMLNISLGFALWARK